MGGQTGWLVGCEYVLPRTCLSLIADSGSGSGT